MPRRTRIAEDDGGAAPISAADWENLPDAAKACRELGHSWPKNLALEFFHVQRRDGRARGKVVGLERRLPCENRCGCIKVTPYVLNGRGWPEPDPTRRSTVRYTRPYRLKRDYPDQMLPVRVDWGASRHHPGSRPGRPARYPVGPGKTKASG